MTQPVPGATETLSPAQRSKIRRLSQPKEPDPGDEAGELNIVPYLDIIMNVLVFVLASVTVTFLTQLDTTPPSSGGKGVKNAIDMDALNLARLGTTASALMISAHRPSGSRSSFASRPMSSAPTRRSAPC